MTMATWSTSNRHPVSSSLIPLLEFEMASLPTVSILLYIQMLLHFTNIVELTESASHCIWQTYCLQSWCPNFLWGTLRLSCALWDIYLRVKFPLIMVLFSQIVYSIMLSSGMQSIIKKHFWIKSLGSSFFRQLMSSAFKNSGLKIIGFC